MGIGLKAYQDPFPESDFSEYRKYAKSQLSSVPADTVQEYPKDFPDLKRIYGRDVLKAVADYVCEPGYEDGIAKTIRKFA